MKPSTKARDFSSAISVAIDEVEKVLVKKDLLS
jgi:hypothetical protein